MAYTTAGLTHGGVTTHYKIEYDKSLSQTDGPNRTNGLLAKCEADFDLLQNLFGGINLPFDYPVLVQVTTKSGGASWNNPAEINIDSGVDSPHIELKPGGPSTADFLRYLLVSEVSEMFMLQQNSGWFQDQTEVHAGDEGSKGEGLSRFLALQFQLSEGRGDVPPLGFAVGILWLNGARPDFVNRNPDDIQPDQTTGCTTLFLYYLHNQLGFSIDSIIAAGASNLAGVYKNLTTTPDGWTPFIDLVNSHYPPGVTYNPAGDNIFPVSELSAFFSPNAIECGYSETTQIFIDRPAMAEVIIRISSDDPSLVIVPDSVTVPVGNMSAPVIVQTAPISGPFNAKVVKVRATYAAKQLTTSVEVVPPAVSVITLSPKSVVCGDGSTGTVVLNRPSLLGDVVVDLICSAPGFATVPPNVTIPATHLSATFPIMTPAIQVSFTTANAEIYAVYSGTSASATLTVRPTVTAGILQNLTIFPSAVTGGNPSHGTVTLEQAVPMDTVVGLAAVESGARLPLPGHGSSVVSVPSSITIQSGQTMGGFQITTRRLAPFTQRTATIMAGAVVTKYAMLTVTS